MLPTIGFPARDANLSRLFLARNRGPPQHSRTVRRPPRSGGGLRVSRAAPPGLRQLRWPPAASCRRPAAGRSWSGNWGRSIHRPCTRASFAKCTRSQAGCRGGSTFNAAADARRRRMRAGRWEFVGVKAPNASARSTSVGMWAISSSGQPQSRSLRQRVAGTARQARVAGWRVPRVGPASSPLLLLC